MPTKKTSTKKEAGGKPNWTELYGLWVPREYGRFAGVRRMDRAAYGAMLLQARDGVYTLPDHLIAVDANISESEVAAVLDRLQAKKLIQRGESTEMVGSIVNNWIIVHAEQAKREMWAAMAEKAAMEKAAEKAVTAAKGGGR